MSDSAAQRSKGAEQNEGAPQNAEPSMNMRRVLNGTIRNGVRSASARGMSSGTATAAGATASSGPITAGGAVKRVPPTTLPTVIQAPMDADLPGPLITGKSKLFGARQAQYDNPWAPGATDKTTGDFLKMLLTRGMGKAPSAAEIQKDLPSAEVELDAIARHGVDDPMRVTWIGHATMLVQMDGLNILTDPMFSERASANQMVGPKRFSPPALSVKDLPRVDVVLLSHNHYDHLDTGSVRAIGDDPLWVVPSGLKGWMAKQNIKNCVELCWWEEIELPAGGGDGVVRVACTPAQHWSTRAFFDKNLSLWCGFAVAGEKERFYFAGDTAYCPVFPKIGERYGPFDLAAIPIGAHEPAWFMKALHCSPEEAVNIHQELGAKRSVAVHWGTFALAADQHANAPRRLVEARRQRRIKSSEFLIIRHGESIVNDGSARRYKCLFGGDDE